MTEQSLPQQIPVDAPQSASLKIVDDLFSLTTHRTLEPMLNQALRMVINILGAEAGSLYFHAHPPKCIQSGAFRPEALKRIQYWETQIGKRLQTTTWKIPPTNSVVSITTLSNQSLVLVNTPLLQDRTVVGLISLVLPPNGKPDKNQQQLLANVAASLGQFATLISEHELAERRLNRLSVFYDVGQALITTFNISRLLSETMALAVNLVDAGAASILLVDEENDELIFKVSHGSGSQLIRQQRIPLDEGIAGWVVRHGKSVVANDARADIRFSHRVDVRTGFLTQSIAAVPLKINGRVIGVLEVLNKYSGDGFTQDDVQLMSYIATQAAIAIENSRLFEQVEKDRDQILKAQDISYQELTRNLHDGTLQLLSAISLSLDHLEILSTKAPPEVVQNQIAAVRNLVHQATDNTRNLLFEMRPAILETQGLVAACHHYVNNLRDISNFNIHFSSLEHVNYGTRVTGHIFSIIQEATNNIRRHGNARNVWLVLDIEKEHFTVTIKDDGVGFDINQFDQSDQLLPHTKLGIAKMKERATQINAELVIDSHTKAPYRGTVVRLILPIPE